MVPVLEKGLQEKMLTLMEKVGVQFVYIEFEIFLLNLKRFLHVVGKVIWSDIEETETD